MKRERKRERRVLLWAATAALTGAVIALYGLDGGAGAPVFAPLGPPERTAASAPVDLNTATAEELDDLPGIGPALAERIVTFRQEHGAFQAPEDVMEVPGIGPAIYEDMAPYIGGEQEGARGEDTGR